MKLNIKAYAVLATVFILSIGTFFLLPKVDNVIGSIIAAPGATALLAALFQLMRDEADYEKKLESQRREFQFTLGAASHIANAAFDKHVEFCEKYMKELHKTVQTLYQKGETPATLEHASELYTLRQDYAIWLTNSINTDLFKFESALRQLGANAHFIEVTANCEAHNEQRSLRIDRNFDLFSRILGLKNSNDIQEKSMVDALKTKVRAILSIQELTKLREHLVKQASNAINA